MAGALRMEVDGSSSSRMAAHVAAICAAAGGLALEVHTSAKSGPILSAGNETIEGAVCVCRYLAAASGDAVAKRLLGDSPEAQAQVWQWLSQCNTLLGNPAAVPGRLLALNLYLQPRAVLVGSGTTISLADVALFSSLYPTLSTLPQAELAGLSNLLRWADYVQNGADLGSIYKKLDVPKAKFAPPAAAAPAPKASIKAAPPATPAAAAPATPSTPQPSSAAGPSVAAAPASKAETKDAGGGEEKEKGSSKESGKQKKAKAPAQKKEVAGGVHVLDIRVGRIQKAWKHPNADALYVEEIDIGEGKPRQVVSGLAKFVPEAEMQGRHVAVLVNVKPGKVRDVMSEGLVLCASNADHTAVEPLAIPAGAKVGEKVTFQGHEGEPEPVLNPKKKQFEALQPELKTNSSGVATYLDVPFMTSAGPCTSTLLGASIK